MRIPIMAGNWKMHGTLVEARERAMGVAVQTAGLGNVEVIIAPPATALAAVAEVVRDTPIKVAAQNMHWADAGAFTGEISPLMVRELATHVILGHSERRHLFAESDEDVQRKVHAAFHHGLVPILCVGETLTERDAGQTDDVVDRQLETAVAGLAPEEGSRLIVAYEPVWAIGTGRACDPGEAQRVIGGIRARLGSLFSVDVASDARLLYGGSVNAANVAAYCQQPDIDGCLVGGASLDAAGFAAMAAVAAVPRV